MSYYTVGYVPNPGQPNPYPQFLIKGRWLDQLGFTTGQSATVTNERAWLVIETEIKF
ncbi:SymE family type I addiction module toxin [Erwinia rhapontici]|uniref:SymE family type I addiction module toxin n=1 Tax=Erwinia rhapontici TaxID=55212 RepID=UPI00143860D5|nr:SymE family type I addiction module toxin [Erwinia rhapontici]